MREKFSNKFVYSFDVARTKPDAELVEISKDSEERGWKNYYRKNYLKR